MNVELAIAGLACFVLAFGHAAIGLRWVLPIVGEGGLRRTPFGPPSLTLSMVRFTWHVVTLMLIGFGVLLAVLAWSPHADLRTVLLRWLAGLWLAATAMACWTTRRRLRSLLRFPVPLFFAVIAIMCGVASL